MNDSALPKKDTSIDIQVQAKVKELRNSSELGILQIENLFKQADRQLENNAISLDWKPFSDFKKEELAKLESYV